MVMTEWNEWESLGGELISDPTVISLGNDRIDVFVRGTDKALWHKMWNGKKWNEWESLGGELISDPTVISLGNDRIDVFVRGTDKALWHKMWIKQ
jgi:hypothetical protein